MTLPHFHLTIKWIATKPLFFRDLHADTNLFAFTVTESSDYFEMEIRRVQGSMFFIREPYFPYKGQVYFSNRPADVFLKEIKALPFESTWKEIPAIW